MGDPEYDLEHTRYGFRWGPMTVERLGSGPFGVVVRIYDKSRHGYVDVRVTPAGRKIDVQEEGIRGERESDG